MATMVVNKLGLLRLRERAAELRASRSVAKRNMQISWPARAEAKIDQSARRTKKHVKSQCSWRSESRGYHPVADPTHRAL